MPKKRGERKREGSTEEGEGGTKRIRRGRRRGETEKEKRRRKRDGGRRISNRRKNAQGREETDMRDGRGREGRRSKGRSVARKPWKEAAGGGSVEKSRENKSEGRREMTSNPFPATRKETQRKLKLHVQ